MMPVSHDAAVRLSVKALLIIDIMFPGMFDASVKGEVSAIGEQIYATFRGWA